MIEEDEPLTSTHAPVYTYAHAYTLHIHASKTLEENIIE